MTVPRKPLRRQRKKVPVPRRKVFVPKINILGVGVDDITDKETIEEILKMATDKKRHHFAVTVNTENIMLSYRNADFARIIEKSDLSVPDGAGVVLSKLILGGKAHSRITGTDLMDKLCAISADKPIRIGLLGGFGNVAEVVKKRQIEKYPGVKIVFAQEGNPTIGQDLKLREDINKVKGIDLLFVAYGMGQQEFWIKRNIKYIDVGLAIGVGGAFDYLAEIKVRAPKIFQKSGLEWLWRLTLEPSRVWRMRVLPLFILLVIKQWFGQNLMVRVKRAKYGKIY